MSWKHVEAAGIRWGVQDFARPGPVKFPPMVLLHGFPLNHSMWQSQVGPLAQRTRLIVPDLPGFGQTGLLSQGETATPTGEAGMGQVAVALDALLDALAVDGPMILAGLSMGGYIALEYAAHFPQRLAGLILTNTRVASDTPEVAAGRLTMAQHVLERGPAILKESMLPRLLGNTTQAVNTELVEQVAGLFAMAPRAGIAAAQRGMAARRDFSAQLDQFTVPTLVIAADEDMVSPPEEMQAWASRMPRAQFQLIRQAGHLAPWEQPGAWNQAVQTWLSCVWGA